nr:MAG TPA: hypothetical protein [Bacteriophage sp.]DAO26142.1 MAG TPA: hypothetical protein [Bacteriophage sp.]
MDRIKLKEGACHSLFFLRHTLLFKKYKNVYFNTSNVVV